MIVIETIESDIGSEIIRYAVVKFSLNFVSANFNPLSSRRLSYIEILKVIYVIFIFSPANEQD